MAIVNHGDGAWMFGDRLKLARARAGLSLRGLEERIGRAVSAQAIGKYEAGKMYPNSATLTALASALDVTLEFLGSAQVAGLTGVEFRKGSNTTAKDAARVEAVVTEQVERYLAIEAVIGIESHEHRLQPPTKVNTYEEAEARAVKLREIWKLGSDPIPGVTRLLESQGIKVFLLDMPEKFSGLTCEVQRASNKPPVPVIVASSKLNIERRRFTLCHELAHRIIGEVSENLDHEKVMHRFSSAFLMPAECIRAEFGKERHAVAYEEIKRIKQTYGVSAAALLMRLRDLKIVSNHYITYLYKTSARTWRTAEPDPINAQCEMAGAEAPQRFEMLVYRALVEKLIGMPRAATLLQKPLHDIEIAVRGPTRSSEHHLA